MAGALAWIVLHPLLLRFPLSLRFSLAWAIFTIGPGIVLGGRLTRDIDPLQRTIVQLGLGSAAVPLLVEILGRVGLIQVFPYVVCALAGLGWSMVGREPGRARVSRADVAACVGITALALTLGAIVFAHRLVDGPQGIAVYGDYDSYDLSHYAAWASDATHTIPPKAAFYAGHGLHAAYYPQLVLTMAHRFVDVPLLPIYFGYAWPVFLTLGALTAFVLVRRIAPTGAAMLAAVLLLVGSDFSYLAAWLLPAKTFQWDYVLWPTNFLAPTMEVLHFNTWTPSLPIFFTALYALARSVQGGAFGWTVAGAFLIAVLFQFKPFAYIILMAGACGAFVFAGRDWALRRRLGILIGLAGLFTIPLIYNVLTLPVEDRRSRLVFELFVLPERMLIKLNLTEAFARFAASLAPVSQLQRPILLLAATALFLAVGPGIRWLGAARIWRALKGDTTGDGAVWRTLGWVVIAGVALPFVIATEPYVDTLQFYQTGLYVWWIFAAAALWEFARAHRVAGAVAIVVALAVSTPSSVHYLARKWSDNQRPVMAELSQGERRIAAYLQTQDPESTVILHSRPTSPSLMAIVSNRRVVLGWGRGQYAVGSEGRVRDINRFFTSAKRDPQEAIDALHRYRVTHVVVRADRDRVHPQVLARLTPLMAFPDAALYGAPAE